MFQKPTQAQVVLMYLIIIFVFVLRFFFIILLLLYGSTSLAKKRTNADLQGEHSVEAFDLNILQNFFFLIF